ncbi:MAG: UPF0175 family protein [Microcystis panniformis]
MTKRIVLDANILTRVDDWPLDTSCQVKETRRNQESLAFSHGSVKQITVDIPDEIAQRLGQTGDNLAHKLLEMVIADAYRAGILSTAEVGRILQLPSRLETHAFLKRMGVYLNYDEIELERDLQTLKELRAK